MSSQTRPDFWVALGLLVTVMLGHLLPLGEGSYIVQQIRDSLHGPAFLVFAWVIWRLAIPRYTVYGTALLVTAAAAIAAPAGELAQVATGKAFSWRDVGHDLLGTACALAFLIGHHAAREDLLPRARARALTAGGVLLLGGVLAPLAWWAWVLAARAMAVPVIAAFEGDWEMALLTAGSRIETPGGWPGVGRFALRLEMPPRKYAGVQFLDPYPHWGGFTDLRFVAAAGDGRAYELNLRIHDEIHDQNFRDRFNRSWQITPEPREICIPLEDVRAAPKGRAMDMDAIDGMTFFLIDTAGGEIVLLDDVRLGYSLRGPCRDS